MTENNLLYWAESGIEADYILTDEPNESETVENRQTESISKSQPRTKLLPLEEVCGVLADYARSDLNDFTKAKIRLLERMKLSQLMVE